MVRKSMKIASRLSAADVAISNVIASPEILSYTSVLGYDEAKLAEGRTLYNEAYQLEQAQQAKYGKQYATTLELNDKWSEVKKIYMKHLKVVRIVLGASHPAYMKLGLTERREQNLSGWLVQAKCFYINVLGDNDVVLELSALGITDEKLKAGQAAVEEVELLNARHQKEVGEAREATKACNRALEKLEKWVSAFIGIARIALEEKLQLHVLA